MAGEAWAKLSDAQKAPYQKQYESKKSQFDKDMDAFLASGGEKAQIKRKAKEGKKSKDPNAPKKPAGGAYGVFLAKNRAAIVKSLPAGHKITDVTKAAGTQWKALSDAAKKPYNDEYLKKMEVYQAELAEYKKNLPEDAEEDDEEEEEEEQPASKKARK